MTVPFAKEQAITRAKFDAWLRPEGKPENWSSENQMMANLWNMMYTSAFRVGHIAEMIMAINQLECRHSIEGRAQFEAKVQAQLTALCRAKVLRSRYDSRGRFYEVNY